MAKRTKISVTTAAVCADDDEQRSTLKAYVTEQRWVDSGCAYRVDQWRELLADAKRGQFNAVCGTADGVRWFAQLSSEPAPKRPASAREDVQSSTAPDRDEAESIIVDRADAMMAVMSVSAELIAESLHADGLLTGTRAATAKRVRRSLIASKQFCATKIGDGMPLIWRRWTPDNHTVEHPDGRRTIYGEVLSTTGIPVQFAIPLKPKSEIVKILARLLVDDYVRRKG
jgi:hypothetical protein